MSSDEGCLSFSFTFLILPTSVQSFLSIQAQVKKEILKEFQNLLKYFFF
jgi:hypothetical protein